MENHLQITFIGAGNVAWHLAQALSSQPDISICEIYSRKLEHAKKLANQCGERVVACNTLDFSQSTASLFVLAVADGVFQEVISKLKLPQKASIVHVSGTHPLELLEGLGTDYGVFYPLQTFSKTKPVDFKEIPFCIEANSSALEANLLTLAALLSDSVRLMSSKERRTLHVAAVWACNFVNYMLIASKDILAVDGLPHDLLAPLVRETIDKAFTIEPLLAQTGPAKRGDYNTMRTHQDFLVENLPDYAHKYQLLSEAIMKRLKDS
ncbi:MAG: DUF2520 domain-containing protein [Bernardetiaceae bacterium]|nr:DUF2520 domain-containing protein [Bernardetiaceae bacterium]